MQRLAPVLIVIACAIPLGGCELLGIENPEKVAAQKEADGKAVGAACRHAGRAIEDCYSLNGKALKSAVFAGWKEMNDYMRENKIDTVAPQVAASTPKSEKATGNSAAEGGEAGKTAEIPAGDAHAGEHRPAKSASRARG